MVEITEIRATCDNCGKSQEFSRYELPKLHGEFDGWYISKDWDECLCADCNPDYEDED